jgi:hypothetical protein
MAFGINGREWSNRTIPFVIDSGDFPIGSANRIAVETAIAEWNENTVIRLIPRLDESDFVVFGDLGTTCRSPVGRSGGRQVITCDLEGGLFTAGSLMHEIGHAVGLFHEQSRPDRNNFVSMGTSTGVNCRIQNDGRLLTDYDCDSIMHYIPNNPSSCNISLIPGGCRSIGQRVRLSGRDIWGASLLYNISMQSVVIWEDDSDVNNIFQVHKSGFSSTGKKCSGPVTVNSRASGQQLAPEVGMAGNRDMVFVWEDDTDGNGFFQIKMRGYGSTGRQSFSQRTVNSDGSGQQRKPHVSVAHDGRFNVVWEDDRDENGVFQIRMRGFNSNGSERFSDRTVNIKADGQQRNPRVAIAPDGYCVAVWQSDANNDGLFDIRMRAFNHDGTERWSDKRVNTRGRGNQRNPRIAIGPFGDFVVVWEDDLDRNGFFQIHMRAFDSNGNEKFTLRTVNTRSAGQQFSPDVAVDDVFRPTVVWSDDQDGNGFFQIRLRGFESDGTERLSERTVNTDADGQQFKPRICMEANGRFVVVWEDDRDNDGNFDILVRGFLPDGTEAFSPKNVSNIIGGTKQKPSIAAPAMDIWDVFNPF